MWSLTPIQKKELIAIAVALVLVVGGVAWFMASGGFQRIKENNSGAEEAVFMGVPEQGSKDFPEYIAIPESTNPSIPGLSVRDRDFNISIERNAFVPNTIVVRKGDTIRVKFTAVDGAYDVVQPQNGLRIELAKGETKLMAASFSVPGKFPIYCERCGGPERGPNGVIIVVAE